MNPINIRMSNSPFLAIIEAIYTFSFYFRLPLQPRQIECVMLAAADQMNDAVAGLPGGQVTTMLSAGGTEGERLVIDFANGTCWATIRDETSCRPSPTLVKGQGCEQAGHVMILPNSILDRHFVGK
jgi:hypothetical protein